MQSESVRCRCSMLAKSHGYRLHMYMRTCKFWPFVSVNIWNHVVFSFENNLIRAFSAIRVCIILAYLIRVCWPTANVCPSNRARLSPPTGVHVPQQSLHTFACVHRRIRNTPAHFARSGPPIYLALFNIDKNFYMFFFCSMLNIHKITKNKKVFFSFYILY